ncbi:MAG: alpha/beta fold hydrolase [Myxococcales bacterium]|jgi:pimeloyl-ACP methyl ester carboxylesterase
MKTSVVVRFLRDRDRRRVAYAVHGRGPMLICPAWWVSHLEKDWYQPDFRAFFEHLGEVATVVRYDRPGVGLSDACDMERTLEDEVALLDTIITELDVRTLSLLGVSCGGPPAIAWSVANPDRVDRLILFGSYARGDDIASSELRDAMCGLVRAHWGAGSRALADVFIPDSTSQQRDAFSALQREVADAVAAERFLRLTYEMDVSDLLGDVRAQTHVFHRREDRAIPFSGGRALAAGIPRAKLVILEGRNHPMWNGGDAAGPIADVLRGRNPTVAAAGCRVDDANRELVRDGERIALTPLEFGVLRYFLGHAGQVVSRDTLIDRVWEQSFSGSNVVDAVVRSLRKKLGEWAPSIETVVGHGYRFESWQRKN